MKILIFIEHSAIIRHFIDSNAFSLIAKKHEVVYALPFGHKRLGKLKKKDVKIKYAKIVNLPVDEKRVSLWSSRFSVELLKGLKGWNSFQIKNSRRIFKNLNPLKIYFLYRFFGMPLIFDIFTYLVNRKLIKNPNKKLEALVKKEKPDVIIHPSVLSGVYINDLVYVGNNFKIPIIVIMNSWDNPSSKRSVVSNNYWLLVWGPQTKMHARKLMNMPDNKVIEFGAAQFDIYSKNPKRSRENILLYHNIRDLNYPTLLYAGSSKNTDEFSHLKKIDNAIILKKIPKVNIIYRPHPWGEGGKNSSRFRNYQFKNIVIDRNMKTYLLNNKKFESNFSAKYSDTRDLLYSVDAVISPLSTILIEAMIMGKSPLCFMPIDEKDTFHFQLAKYNTHFKELLSKKEIIVVWGGNNLLTGIKDLINKIKNKENHTNLKKESEFFVKSFNVTFKKRILDFVEEIDKSSKNKIIN
ncbi:hypothetical protein CU313_06945 [Prochlorococcus marinus str. MU1404]|uniref:hypothetical protein n=1 Tax=Prochlorococcus marinus TaxID=1219 RepID=UPI001ADBA46F|nr:hypothetical protein [Prochlorococcus marinus]MBO8230558.1 hypothetical protein [Prochlorococcus marinus XMU1404]MBW3073604.1 hypothetical protein [Prochlorococcus marinus str. MU1404]MCR8545109.1 hypothetical protein [Prochlorococcus marinus CUG1432]